MKHLLIYFILSLVGIGLGTVNCEASPKIDQSLCIACHGAFGKGNKFLNAPGLANLDAWYIERQLQNFRDDKRGVHPDDDNGAQMRPIVQSLSDESIQEYARVISAYPDNLTGETVVGDATKGKAYYAHQCGACHGPGGKGIKAIGAPRLAGLDDWYLASQLDNFQAGIRGTVEGDTYGAQMVFYMKRLKSIEDLNDIIAYLRNPQAVDMGTSD
mgnify:CR=1 FL=1|jgi:cytochrome c oxidase subunit II